MEIRKFKDGEFTDISKSIAQLLAGLPVSIAKGILEGCVRNVSSGSIFNPSFDWKEYLGYSQEKE